MGKINSSRTEWNLSTLFEGDNDPKMIEEEQIIKLKVQEFIKKWSKEDFTKNPAILKQALDDYENLNAYYGTSGKQGYYFWLKSKKCQTDPEIKAKLTKIEEFSKKLDNEIQFFILKIAKIPEKEHKSFLSSPELSNYKHFLERQFKKSKYLLTEAEEKIMNLKSTTAHDNWEKLTQEFLSKEEREVINKENKKEKKNFSEIQGLLENKDKKIRDNAAKAFNEILEKNLDLAETEINSILLDKKINDEIRGFKNPEQARHLADDVDSEVVQSLIGAVSKRFDISRRYYQLKAKLLGLNKLAYHERNVPYGKIDKKYSYEESVTLISKVMQDLNKKFFEIFKDFVENGNIDVLPKKGKESGALCSYWLKSHPTFILLNHNESLKDVLTIAHEVGHGINFELMKKKENSLNFEISTATAETASTFMEDFVLQELLNQADDELKLEILMMKLNDDISTILRQVACYNLERDLHKSFREKGYLSKQEIGLIFQKNMKSYMGDGVSQDKGSENWWVSWTHIRKFFYVYSYASGLLISKSLQNSFKKDKKFMTKITEFLSTGMSASPKEIFQKLGINMNEDFWNQGLNEIEATLNETEALAKKLGKI